MGFVAFAALVLAVFSLVYVALSVVVTLIWRKRIPRLAAPQPLPPVSVLKPLCGLEPGLLENLRSFCEQSHTNYEILFGARDANDPALEVARRVAAEYPHVDIRVIPGATRIGENRKCNTLAHLKMFARYDMIVINDSDVRVGPHYLQRVVEPLTDPSVGIVSCSYRGRPAGGLWAELGALAIEKGSSRRCWWPTRWGRTPTARARRWHCVARCSPRSVASRSWPLCWPTTMSSGSACGSLG